MYTSQIFAQSQHNGAAATFTNSAACCQNSLLPAFCCHQLNGKRTAGGSGVPWGQQGTLTQTKHCTHAKIYIQILNFWSAYICLGPFNF